MNWFAGVANRSKALTNYLLEDYEPADPKWSPTSQSELAARQPATPSKETGQARMLKEYIAELCKQPNTFIKVRTISYLCVTTSTLISLIVSPRGLRR